MSKWTRINDVTDEILLAILTYGCIEDLVSKERVSTRFQSIISQALKKRKRFKTKSDFFSDLESIPRSEAQSSFSILLNIVQRMPNLIDDSIVAMVGRRRQMLSKLAKNHPPLYKHFRKEIAKIKPDDEYYMIEDLPYLLYLGYVKKFNPDYRTEDADYIFHEKSMETWIDDEMFAQLPGFKVKLQLHGRDFNNGRFDDMCYSLILGLDGRLNGTKDFDSVSEVIVKNDFIFYNSLKRLSNMKALKIDKKKCQFRSIYPNIRSTIQYLTINCKEWNVEDRNALAMIIDTYPLRSIKINGFPVRHVLDMILNSPMRTIKSFSLCPQNRPFHGRYDDLQDPANYPYNEDIPVDDIKIEDGMLVIENDSNFNEQLVRQILIRFTHVHTIEVHVRHVDQVDEIIQDIEEEHRCRCIQIQIIEEDN